MINCSAGRRGVIYLIDLVVFRLSKHSPQSICREFVSPVGYFSNYSSIVFASTYWAPSLPSSVRYDIMQPWGSDETFLLPRNLIIWWPYWEIVTLGNSEIEFCNKCGAPPWPIVRILTQHDSVSESRGSVHPPSRYHIEWCITIYIKDMLYNIPLCWLLNLEMNESNLLLKYDTILYIFVHLMIDILTRQKHEFGLLSISHRK